MASPSGSSTVLLLDLLLEELGEVGPEGAASRRLEPPDMGDSGGAEVMSSPCSFLARFRARCKPL